MLPSYVLSCPYYDVFEQDPTLSHLITFGCLCYAIVLNNKDKLFESRYEKCVFIHYSNSKKGCKLFSHGNKTIIFSRDVKFHEIVFPLKSKIKKIL